MSTLTREQLLEMFDPLHEVRFAQNPDTTIQRYFDAEARSPFIEKSYKNQMSDLQQRENSLLFDVAQKTVLGQQVSSRVAAFHSGKKPSSVLAGFQISLKWYGFDLDDWDKLLHGVQPNPMHQAPWLLDLARGVLKALQLLHSAGYVHSDIHMANLCLPHGDLTVSPDGKTISCTVEPDKLKLIDLGMSLKPSAERGLPPRRKAKTGELGAVFQFHPLIMPPNPPFLIAAYAAAQGTNEKASDIAPFLALDWRVDLWRCGKLLELWNREAWDATGLVGTPPQRRLVGNLADDLSKCEPGSDHDASGTLPHQMFIDQIDDAIGKSKPRELLIPLGSAKPLWVKNWGEAQERVAAPAFKATPTSLPKPKQAPVPAPAQATVDAKELTASGDASKGNAGRNLKYSAWAVTAALAGWYLVEVDAKKNLVPLPAKVAESVAAPAKVPPPRPATAYAVGQPAPAHAGAPVLIVLPKVLASGAGSKLGASGTLALYADEKPPYEARLPYNMAMGQSEVTFEQWNQCVSEGGCNKGDGDVEKWGEGQRPVINVSWNDIQGLDKDGRPEAGKGYLNWLNKKAGLAADSPTRYRLPTEAEWELAARAGSDGQWSLGKDNQAVLSDKTANYAASVTFANSVKGQYRQQTVPVKSFEPNAWGLYDMHGNAWEWVHDCYAEKEYERRVSANGWNASQSAPEVPQCRRVLRGGGWVSSPQVLRSAIRYNYSPGVRFSHVGFRVARTLP